MSDLSRERRLEIPRGEPQEPQTSKSSPFEQLLAFNTAAREVKELFNQNDVPRDQVERVVRSFNFPPRQHKAFMRGVDIFLSRRRDVLETKRVYEERFGKRAGEMAFQDFFGLSDTFGAVELSENNG